MPEPVNYPSFSPKKNNKIIFIFLTVIFILVLFIISEYIYLIRNQPDKITNIYINLASISAQKKLLRPSIFFLDKAAKLTLNHRAQNKPEINLKTIQKLPKIPNNQQLKQALTNYLSTINYRSLVNPNSNEWVETYYNLGLISYNNSNFGLVEPFWQTAVNFGPEWSYFHLSLANYYLSTNQIDLAYQQIDYCLIFTHPQKACNRFLKDNMQTGKTDPINLWEKEVNL